MVSCVFITNQTRTLFLLGALATLALELDTLVKIKSDGNISSGDNSGGEAGKRAAAAHRSAIGLADKVHMSQLALFDSSSA